MSDPLAKVVTVLKTEKVIPDVIPATANFLPSVLFHIVWPSNGTEVVLGNKVPRGLTLDEPEIKVLPEVAPKEDKVDSTHPSTLSYTLVMTDPDAPSRADPKFAQWRHWVLPGLKLPPEKAGETEGAFALKTRTATTPYYPPAPPPGTGYHRYIFLLYEEPAGGITIPGNAVEHSGEPASRRLWNATAFANKHHLKLVGANFFETQADQ